MTINQNRIISFGILLILFLCSCTSRTTNLKESDFSKLFVNTNINKDLKLFEFDETKLVLGQVVNLALVSLAEEEIDINLKEGVHILRYENNKWVTIKDRTNYRGDSYLKRIPFFGKKSGTVDLLSCIPDVSDLSKPVNVRIVVEGTKTESRGEVLAFIDVTLTPP